MCRKNRHNGRCYLTHVTWRGKMVALHGGEWLPCKAITNAFINVIFKYIGCYRDNMWSNKFHTVHFTTLRTSLFRYFFELVYTCFHMKRGHQPSYETRTATLVGHWLKLLKVGNPDCNLWNTRLSSVLHNLCLNGRNQWFCACRSAVNFMAPQEGVTVNKCTLLQLRAIIHNHLWFENLIERQGVQHEKKMVTIRTTNCKELSNAHIPRRLSSFQMGPGIHVAHEFMQLMNMFCV